MKENNIELLLKQEEEVVISGMSGRFPESDSTDEFAKNLYNKVDMITEDDRRWPTGEIYITRTLI
jgi:acyl transferase domain-containing protein